MKRTVTLAVAAFTVWAVACKSEEPKGLEKPADEVAAVAPQEAPGMEKASGIGSPNLAITSATVVCATLTQALPPYSLARIVKECDASDQVELEITIKNIGSAEAVINNGRLWDLVKDTAAPAAFSEFSAAPSRAVFSAPQPMTPGMHPVALPPYIPLFVSVPATGTFKLPAGQSITQQFLLAPAGKLAAGRYTLKLEVDPQNKVYDYVGDDKMTLPLTVYPLEEWVTCPGTDIPNASFWVEVKNGHLDCIYHYNVYLTKTITSSWGKPFTACFRSNASPNAQQVYCSYRRSQADLVKEAYGWSTNANDKRVVAGIREDINQLKPDEPIHACRLKLGSDFYFGRIWRNRCYYRAGQAEVRIDSGFEYLVHTKPYGVGWFTQDESLALQWQPGASGPPLRICRVTGVPNGLAGSLGLAAYMFGAFPGLSVAPGTPCVGTAKGAIATEAPPQVFLTLN